MKKYHLEKKCLCIPKKELITNANIHKYMWNMISELHKPKLQNLLIKRPVKKDDDEM